MASSSDAPPQAAEPDAPAGGSAPGSPTLQSLRKRADFLRAASARRQGTRGLMLQGRQRRPDEPATGIRVGFTCSKKIGNAVRRNRAKRRLRAAARIVLPGAARPGWDYVLVGRPGATVERDFAALVDDLRHALASVHAPARKGAPPRKAPRS